MDRLILVLFIASVLVGSWLLLNSVQTTLAAESAACKALGGDPVEVSGATICFAPNVVLKTGEPQ